MNSKLVKRKSTTRYGDETMLQTIWYNMG